VCIYDEKIPHSNNNCMYESMYTWWGTSTCIYVLYVCIYGDTIPYLNANCMYVCVVWGGYD